jgi:hypothetical protein
MLTLIEPEESRIRELFPALTEEHLKAKREFLDGYLEVALKIFERLEKDGILGIDEQD